MEDYFLISIIIIATIIGMVWFNASDYSGDKRVVWIIPVISGLTVFYIINSQQKNNKMMAIIEQNIKENRSFRDLVNQKDRLSDLQNDDTKTYIIIDLPEMYRGMFQDFLQGFEEFCKLKGYSVKFSVDNSVPDKFAFRVEVDEKSGLTSEQFKKDFKEYSDKVRIGSSFDNMPKVISEADYKRAVSKLNGRIKFLVEQNKNLKLKSDVTENILKQLDNINFKLNAQQQPPNVIVNFGSNTSMSPVQNLANNLTQGNNSPINDSSVNIEISNSFNKRKEQVTKIDEIIKMLYAEKGNDEELSKLRTELSKIKIELEEKEQPDKSRISKALDKLYLGTEALVFAHHTVDAINWLLESFKYVGEMVK